MASEPDDQVLPTCWSAPVRYVEVDAQKIVFNAHYLVWCDEALAAFFDAGPFPYSEVETDTAGPRLVSTELTWSSSARLGDVVDVGVGIERAGRTSFVVAFDIRVGERPVARARTTYVMTDPAGTPVPVPDGIRGLVRAP